MSLLLAAALTFLPLDAGLPQSGMWRHGFAAADMNGDGHRDLVFTSPRKEPGPPVIYLNDGSGRFTRWEEAAFPPLAFDYGAVEAADFDANGTTDLAVAVHYRGVLVLLGDGRGGFTAVTDGFAYPSTFSSRALTVIDWNGDGRLDVAALSDGPRPLAVVQLGVTVFENFGAAWRPARATNPDAIFGDAIAAGDVDGDGLGDLLTASQSAGDQRVLRLGADGGLAARKIDTLRALFTVHAVEMTDFDGDGRDEMVIGYSAGTPSVASLEVVAYPAGSRPTRELWTGEGATIQAVASGDLDGDGATDLVAALHDGRLMTFRGDGRGGLARDADIEPVRRGCTVYALRVADLNGDGKGEVIAAFAGESGCPSNGGVEAWRAVPRMNRRRAVSR